VLERIDLARVQVEEAAASLRATLSVVPLAKAYSQFKDEGGISASDWQRWLNSESLGGTRHASKQHLRIVSAREVPSIPCRASRMPELEEELAETEEYDDGHDAA
jgi:hypothetical protein